MPWITRSFMGGCKMTTPDNCLDLFALFNGRRVPVRMGDGAIEFVGGEVARSTRIHVVCHDAADVEIREKIIKDWGYPVDVIVKPRPVIRPVYRRRPQPVRPDRPRLLRRAALARIGRRQKRGSGFQPDRLNGQRVYSVRLKT